MRYKGSSKTDLGVPVGRSIVPQKRSQIQRALATITTRRAS